MARIQPIAAILLAALATAGALADDKAKVALEIKGIIVPVRQTTVAAATLGRIVEVMVEEGQRVKSGDIFARLDSAETEAILRVAQSKLKLAQARHENANNGGRTTEVAVAAAAVEVAKAEVRLAEVRLDGRVLRAPFDGVVVTRHADVGAVLNPVAGGRLCDLADLSTLEAEIEVREADLGKVAVGQACQVHVDAFPDRRIEGRVVRVVPVVNAAKATVAVRVRLERRGEDDRLLPGMTAIVRVLGK